MPLRTRTHHDIEELLTSSKHLLELALKLSHRGEEGLEVPEEIRKAQRHAELAVQYIGRVSPELRDDRDHLRETVDLIVQEQMKRLSETKAPAPPPREAPTPQHQKKDPPSKGLRGDTRTIGLSDLINWLGVQEKNGVLEVTTKDEVITLVFAKGTLTNACSNASPPGTRLGEILVQTGVIDEATLNEVLSNYSSSSSARHLGEALEQEKFVSKKDLRAALEMQVQMLFNRVFSTASATFVFHENVSPETDGRISINLTTLLLESARQHDESTLKSTQSSDP